MKRMSADEYRKILSSSTKSKYNNQKTTIDSITFDSKAEARRYGELQILQKSGEIKGFGRQPSFVIDDSGSRYRPDFIVCGKNNELWVEDVKGMETPVFKLKKRRWEENYPWLPLILIK